MAESTARSQDSGQNGPLSMAVSSFARPAVVGRLGSGARPGLQAAWLYSFGPVEREDQPTEYRHRSSPGSAEYLLQMQGPLRAACPTWRARSPDSSRPG